jgi:hypothetical protein
MFAIDEENNIEVTRGDTLRLKITPIINLDVVERIFLLNGNDTVKFTLKMDEYEQIPLIEREATRNNQNAETGAVEINLSADETKQLEYGTYKYDCQLNAFVKELYTVATFIMAKFKVTSEISN